MRARNILGAAFAAAVGLTGNLTGASAENSALLDKLRQPIPCISFGAPFAPPKGKSITLITCGAIGEGCQVGASAAAEAAQQLGWKTRIVDGRFDPSVWNQAVQQAVADGANGIIVFAITPALIQGGLDAAKAAKVPIITVFQPKFEGVPEVQGYVTADHAQGGEVAADLIASDSKGAGKVLLLDTVEFPEIMKRNDALAKRLASVCAGCMLSRVAFNGALASQRLAPLVANQLQQNPSIGYVVGPYDATGPFITDGIRQAQKTGNVKYLNFEGNPIGLDLMANGDQFADVAVSQSFSGWLAIDLMARILAGETPPSVVELPQHVFVQGDKLPLSGGVWMLDFDFKSELRHVWKY